MDEKKKTKQNRVKFVNNKIIYFKINLNKGSQPYLLPTHKKKT